MIQCEVCGNRILGKPNKAIIEGAKMIVCGKCAKLRSGGWTEKPLRRIRKNSQPQTRTSISREKQGLPLTEALELVDDFSVVAKKAREKLKLSQEDLGRRIGEKISVLRKIESGKVSPNHRLAKKLEHVLKVKLLVPSSEPKIPHLHRRQPREITLGEIAQLTKREREVAKKRKQS